MALTISTWMHVDNEKQSATYPSAGQNSADFGVQLVYWRCIGTFFAVARSTNPHHRLRLYTNLEVLPTIDSVNLGEFLRSIDVEIVTMPISYLPPREHSKTWRNQFYIFDVIDHVVRNNENDVQLVLDSDCLILDDLAYMAPMAEQLGALTLACEAKGPNEEINGISLNGMSELFRRTEGLVSGSINTAQRLPAYYAGGEFFCASPDLVRKISMAMPKVWELELTWIGQQAQRFMEEAHLLSFHYWRHNIPFGTANQFCKRIWTAFSYSNVRPEDVHLPIWHLPAEKHYGFRRLWLGRIVPSFSIGQTIRVFPREELAMAMGIPRRSATKALSDISYRYHRKLFAR